MAKPKSKSKPNYSKICTNADGGPVTLAFEKLGPINDFNDLLSKSKDPSTQLAAEQILHAIEGWRYVSSATYSYLINSKGNATHLAYYAELRAALSLFSYSGIRIKQGDNYYVDSSDTKCSVPFERTHTMAWAMWKEWVKRNDSKDLILKGIKILPTLQLNDFTNALTGFAPDKLFNNWGLDLIKLDKDHSARNDMSYTAYWLKTPLTHMQTNDVTIVSNLWKLLFSSGSTFGFDVALIQQLVDRTARGLVIGAEPNFDQELESKRKAIAKRASDSTGISESQIYEALKPGEFDFSPLVKAEEPKTDADNVLCRAFFLLRFATLAVRNNLELAKDESAKAWLQHWLEHAGIWDPKSGVDQQDVYQDYQDSVNTLTSSGDLPSSLWLGENCQHASRIARPEASLAWSLS